jgi:hypothetical protein
MNKKKSLGPYSTARDKSSHFYPDEFSRNATCESGWENVERDLPRLHRPSTRCNTKFELGAKRMESDSAAGLHGYDDGIYGSEVGDEMVYHEADPCG